MVDCIIVGQGIAGSVLALQLLQAGQRVLVINNTAQNRASSAAAGMYNPITGKAMVKTWLADTLFPYLTHFYRVAEQILDASFLHARPIFRPFLTAEERMNWLQKATQAAYTPFIQAVSDVSYHQDHMQYHHGGLILQHSGYVDVPHFLAATRAYLQAQQAYIEADFDHGAIQLHDGVHYQGIVAQRLIFCEGPQAVSNPFFHTIPLRPVKGEWLSVTLDYPLDVIYNRGIFVLSRHGTQAMVGATYQRQAVTLEPTLAARQELEARLNHTFRLSYYVQDQRVGIRPTTRDHKPLIGLHHRYPQLGIFNGLGTKGVSLAPYFAHVFVQHLLYQRDLPREVIWSRYKNV